MEIHHDPVESCHQTRKKYTNVECTVETFRLWAKEMPKHVEFFDKIKFGKFVRLVGFIKRKFVTMYGHMKVKLHEILKSYTRSFSKNLNLCLGNCWS